MHSAETVILKLRNPTRRKRAWLDAMQSSYREAVQLGLDHAHALRTSSRAKIHSDSYRQMRDVGLPADYARMAVNTTVALARSHYGLRKAKRRASYPTAPRGGIGLGINAYTLRAATLRIATGTRGSYIWAPLCIPAKYRDAMQHVHGDAKLFQRGHDWFVMLPLRIPIAPAVRDGDPTVIGVDLGIVRLMSATTPRGIQHWNGKAVRHQKERYATLRKRYQRQHRTDKVRQQKGRERRWQQDVNHKLSRELANLAAQYPNGVIAFESLDGIRDRVRGSKRFNRMISNWAFRDLIDKVKYKAAKLGVRVTFVDPRGTSKTCNKCGHATRSNRPTQGDFRCVACGYTANADANAAINIAALALDALRQEALDTPPGNAEVEATTARPDGAKA